MADHNWDLLSSAWTGSFVVPWTERENVSAITRDDLACNSWLFSRLLGDVSVRFLGDVSCGLAAIGFVVGGIVIFLMQG